MAPFASDARQNAFIARGHKDAKKALIEAWVHKSGISACSSLNAAIRNIEEDAAQKRRVLLGKGNASISGETIRGVIKHLMQAGGDPEELKQRVLKVVVEHNINLPQLLSALQGERHWSVEGMRDFLKCQGLECSAGDWETIEDQIKNSVGDKTAIQNADAVLFGIGNSAISSDEIKDFLKSPGLLRRDALNAALEHGVSVTQVLVAMKGRPGWSPAEIRAYLETQSVKAPAHYWTEVSELLSVMYGRKRDRHQAVMVLFGHGNADISAPDIRAFVKNTRSSAQWTTETVRQLVEVAISNHVSVEQIVLAMRDEEGWGAKALRKFLSSQGLDAPSGDVYWAQLEQRLALRHKQQPSARVTALGAVA